MLFFSLEMGRLELTQRILSSQARVDSTRMRNGKLSADDWQKITNGVRSLADATLFIDDKAENIEGAKTAGWHGIRFIDAAQLERDLAGLIGLRADQRVDDRFENFLGGFLGDFLDLHAALGGRHEHHPAGGTVEHRAQVQFAGDVGAGFHQNFGDRLAVFIGLERHQALAQPLLGEFRRFLGAVVFGRDVAAVFEADHLRFSPMRMRGSSVEYGSLVLPQTQINAVSKSPV